jgi:hypothetical protein
MEISMEEPIRMLSLVRIESQREGQVIVHFKLKSLIGDDVLLKVSVFVDGLAGVDEILANAFQKLRKYFMAIFEESRRNPLTFD